MIGNILQKKTSVSLAVIVLALSMFAACSKAPDERQLTLSYEVRVNDIPEGAQTLDIYLPYPPQTEVQTIIGQHTVDIEGQEFDTLESFDKLFARQVSHDILILYSV